MPKYRLTYFHTRGRAEISRLIFAAAGQEYEDRRFQEFVEPDYFKVIEMKDEDRKYTDEWLEFKPSTPFGVAPVLEVDGHMIAQSRVIAAYLGRKLGLAGKTDLDDARADMIYETTQEILAEAVFNLLVVQDKEKQAKDVTKYASETLPNILARLEKLVGEKGYFVADQLTYADIAFYFNSSWISFLKLEIDWEKYPKLKSVYDNVAKNPGIAKWVKERPETQF